MPRQSDLGGLPMNAKRRTRQSQFGFNIVELMVAIAIGGILLTGAISLFVNNRATARITQDLSRLQENGRFAMDFIQADLRMAGFFGCAQNVDFDVNSEMGAVSGQLWDPSVHLEGIDDYEDGDPSWFPSQFDDSALNELSVAAGTDALTIRYLAARLPDHALIHHLDDTITVTATTNMTEGTVLGVANCKGVDIVRLSNINDGGDDPVLTTDGVLSRTYLPTDDTNTSIAAPLAARRYFIATNDFGNLSLYRATIAVDAGGDLVEQNRELFEGISDLQVLYGLDTNDDQIADSYVSAGPPDLGNDQDAWANVVAVKIGILAMSTEGQGEPTQQILGSLLDKQLDTVTDSLRRRLFSTTVQIRNSAASPIQEE